ncbi:DUF1850 domain-containing protein [Nesterenkonia xinjiangensis]|uniref:DUF1850 domain-containing protein n=1 Tax=Nesterenkonia xinjiangensis TaxID=225327 RepID=A0A7Z0GNR1_9MICC|nr:DUF1850 domain-containing protein [Nesterenkonia xinjiangensis]NYJ78879.1 hypothetical protein [Nesterenkonia xinjiangensis]
MTRRTRPTTSDLPEDLTRRRLLTHAGAAAAVALTSPLLLVGCGSGSRLICRHQRTEEVYASVPVEIGSIITHSWVHSIERSRWTDSYRVDGDTLMLVRTEFEEYGAGMPLDEGTVSIQDGTVVIEDIDRAFEAIRWIHSHRVDYRIGVDGDTGLIDARELPDSEPLELRPG